MYKKLKLEKLRTRVLASLLILLISSAYGFANEQFDTGARMESQYIEIEVVDDLNLSDNKKGFFFAKSTISDYKPESLNSRDILRSVPSITSKDNKTLGLVIPPFAYFKTKF